MSTKDTQTSTTTALAKPTSSALAPAPDYITNDRRGMEDMEQSDMLIPRLALAQALSPQVTEGDPRKIDGLKPGDLFNSVTNEPYGREVRIQVLRKMPLRAMQFNRVEDGGGVADPNVPLDDDRLKSHGDAKPVATLFRDYIALLLSGGSGGEILALSFKSTGIKVAKTLNGLMAFRNRPIFAGQYKITTAMNLVPKPHWIYKVENDGWVTAEQAAYGEQMYEAATGINAEQIQREAESEHEEFVNADGAHRVGPDM